MIDRYNQFIEKHGISASTLKILAMALMVIDHCGMILFMDADFYWTLRGVGRLSFPLFAFLVAEGIAHSKDLVNYSFRMLIFAMVSEIPFSIIRSGKIFALGSCNVFFTYFIPILIIAISKKFEDNKRSNLITGICVIMGVGSAYIFNPEYGYNGVLLVLLLYYFRNAGLIRYLVAGVFMFATWSGIQLYALLALPVMMLYNGQRGFFNTSFLRHALYIFYPAHLLLLYLIKVITG